ncbi:MAG: hypothetical protein K2I21_00160, partial [Acetatifactor sp.]|nr:hypothetical protein [Acetatifactor sp.]
MWIMDLLQAGKQTGNTQNVQSAQNAQGTQQSAALLQKEIRALAPGQILSGQILEKSGEELKLLVNFQGSELELQARLEQNMALSMGRNILFQVKNNGSSLSLSPLFENMGMEANAQKAVEMASLPVNDTTMQLAGQLMREGMPIDKEALQNFYHEVTTFADAEIMDIIDLHKLGLPVNAENLEQISSYKNMTHQLMGGINELSEQLPQLLQDMAAKGMDREIGKLLETLLLGADGKPAAELEETTVSQQPGEPGLAESQPGESGAAAAQEAASQEPEVQQGQVKIVIAEDNVETQPKPLQNGENPENAAESPKGQETSVGEQTRQPGQTAAANLLRQTAQA